MNRRTFGLFGFLALFCLTLAAEPISTNERDRAMSALHASRKQFLDSIAGLSDQQLDFKPAPDRWSVREVAEHIALSEDLIGQQTIEGKIMHLPATPEKRKSPPNAEADMKIADGVADRSRKVQAPEALMPERAKFASMPELVASFKANRDQFIKWIESRPDGMRDRFLQGPVPGVEWDAYQWVYMLVGHTRRHVAQLEEVKADSRFPKK